MDALGTEEEELITTYDLRTFPMRVQSLNPTLIDKVFAVCDYYLQGKAHRNARHLYDIYKLTEHVEIDDDFLKLVKEVRAHRITMGREIAPAAPLDVNILGLVQKFCDEGFYKEDYRETTLKLILSTLMKNVFPNEVSAECFRRIDRRHPVWKSEAEYKTFFLGKTAGGYA